MRRIFDADAWREIFQSIQRNKTRAILTMLGVFIGIFIYISLAGAAQGMKNGFDDLFKGIATNSMFVWAENTTMPYAGFKRGRQIQLKLDDANYIKERIPEIMAIAPRNVQGLWGGAPAKVNRGLKSGNYAVFGDYPEFTKIAPKKIFEGGRFINKEDISGQRKVCVIGERTKRELFEEDEEALGQFITIDDMNFKVVGIHKFEGGGPFDNDSDVFIPYSTYQKLYNTGDNVSWFVIAAYDDADVELVEDKVKQF